MLATFSKQCKLGSMIRKLMVGGMIGKNERQHFAVVVKSRGQPATPWRSEIYRAGRSSAVEQSAIFFSDGDGRPQGGKGSIGPTIQKT
jgi:hypothetical protein